MSRKDEGLLYDELESRKRLLDSWTSNKIFNYFDVYNRIVKVNELGLEAYLKNSNR
jgi:flagellar protein FlaI